MKMIFLGYTPTTEYSDVLFAPKVTFGIGNKARAFVDSLWAIMKSTLAFATCIFQNRLFETSRQVFLYYYHVYTPKLISSTLGFYSSTLNATIKSLTVWTIFALSALYVGESLKSFIGLFQESFQTHSTFSKSWGGT